LAHGDSEIFLCVLSPPRCNSFFCEKRTHQVQRLCALSVLYWMMMSTSIFLVLLSCRFMASATAGEFQPFAVRDRKPGGEVVEINFDDVVLMSTGAEVPTATSPMFALSDDDVDEATFGTEQDRQEHQKVDWQMLFAAGFRSSEEVAAKDEVHAGKWEADADTGAAVPSQMLSAEARMLEALQIAPEDKDKKEKTAVYALRLYNHAKWLAEKNHATAAEQRYRKSKDFALMCRRSVMAGHALSRLGYFLVNWGRHAEARSVLEESVQISKKSNPLAPYLLGVLDRKAAAAEADSERLRLADDRILSAEKQPSEDLEEQRLNLVSEIKFWHEASASAKKCVEASNVAHVAICLVAHVAGPFQRMFTELGQHHKHG